MCAVRRKLTSCCEIADRKSCLTSTESRKKEEDGVNIEGIECAWCKNVPCVHNSAEHKDHHCEPKNWLEVKKVKEFETCLNVDEIGNN